MDMILFKPYLLFIPYETIFVYNNVYIIKLIQCRHTNTTIMIIVNNNSMFYYALNFEFIKIKLIYKCQCCYLHFIVNITVSHLSIYHKYCIRHIITIIIILYSIIILYIYMYVYLAIGRNN